MVGLLREPKDNFYDRLHRSIILPSSIVEFYPDATLIIDNRGRVAAWNKAMEKMTGVSARDMLGKGDYEYAIPFYGERKPMLVDMVGLPGEEVSDGYTDVIVEDDRLEAMTIKAKVKGRDVVLWSAAARLYGLDGKPVGAIESIRDVTLQKLMEEKLKESEEKYRLITTSTNDGIITLDSSGIITYINPSGQKMLRKDAKHIIGRHFTDFIADGYKEKVVEEFYRGLAGESIAPFEIEAVDDSGKRLHVELSGSALGSTTDRAVIVAVRDVSERWKARMELKKAHEGLERRVEERMAELSKARSMLQAVLDTIPASITVADAGTGKVSYTNKGAARLFGDRIASIDLGSEQRPYMLLWPDGSPMRLGDSPLNRSLIRGEYVSDKEMLVRHPDGVEISALVSSAPVLDGGRIVGAVASAIDITERKIMESALKEAKEQAELYLSLMGHDINNMNQVAMGYLEMAASIVRPGDAASTLIGRSLGVLRDSSRLIDNLRKVQQAVGKKLKLEKVDLDAMLSQVKLEYSLVPGREVAIHYKPARGYVMANQLLKDVFLNIVGNAIKHSAGPIQVAIRASSRKDHGKNCYEVSIEDDGPGIPDGRKSSIFSRAGRGATKAMGGGLGLYIVKSLVEGFNGRVWVEDRVAGDYSKGCRFVVVLPAID